MTSTRLATDVAPSPVHALVSLASHLAAAELVERDRATAADPRDLARRLEEAVAGAIAPGSSPLRLDPIRSHALMPQHYEAMRSALVGVAADGGQGVSGSDLARVLRALDDAMRSQSEDSAGQFTRHLATPEAVEAVVEIAHDMRSPLTSILFLVETLRRGHSGPVTAVQERQLGLIYGAALGLNGIACDVIDAVRGGQSLVDGRAIPFSVAELMIGISHTVRPIAEEKRLELRLELPETDAWMGYPGAIGRVLLNLLTNALKYTQSGHVTMGCAPVGDDRLAFWVQDTGQGIPAHVQALLFDGFRPSASGMRFSNAGLGLAICQNFLRAMGTSLALETSPDAGTRFSFELTLRRA